MEYFFFRRAESSETTLKMEENAGALWCNDFVVGRGNKADVFSNLSFDAYASGSISVGRFRADFLAVPFLLCLRPAAFRLVPLL